MIKFIGKWGKNREGATAIEFAFLAMPYLLLSLGIIELSLMFVSESMLEGATTRASRVVKTGQLQQSGTADLEGDFRAKLCQHAPVLIRCDDVIIEARVMTSFADFETMQPQFDDDGQMETNGFSLGGSSEKILIRVAYTYTSFTPLVGQMLWGPDSSRMFMSTIVLQSEPYDFSEEMALDGGA